MRGFTKKAQRLRAVAVSVLIFGAFVLSGAGVLLQNAKAEAPADIVAPETGFNALAHYEFQDETNLGKDTLGNYDLVAKNLSVDPVNGGIALKNNGFLYAPAIGEVTGDEYTDFSDLMKGSYSVSVRAYLRANNGGGNYLITTGSYGSDYTMNWVYGGIGMDFGSGQKEEFGTNDQNGDGKQMLDGNFSWYRINCVYDEQALTFTVTATKEGDEDWAFRKTHTLTGPIAFGGHKTYGFTIGAQSHLGGWDDGHASAELEDGTIIYPNLSDVRIYSGAIDDAEIAKIAKYDADNLAAEETPVYDTNPIAAWDFSDASNPGADTMGNVDLILKNTGSSDHEIADGALTLKNNNLLYAGDLGKGEDISDKLTAFTLAFDVKMDKPADSDEHDIVSTARYADGFRVTRCGNQLRLYFGGGKNIVADNVFPETAQWQKIIVTGDESKNYIAVYINAVEEKTATLIGSSSDQPVAFGTELCLTFGGWSKFGAEDWAYTNPTLDNIKLYDFTITSAQATQLLTEEKVQTENTQVKEIKKLSASFEISADAGETEILTSDQLPKTVEVVNEANQTLTANILWTKVEKGEFSATVTGFIYGPGINNYANTKVSLSVAYQLTEEDAREILPLVWYEFKDADRLGKDSMGNFDLELGGNGQIEYNAEGQYVTFSRDAASFLYAPAVTGTSDWSDLVKGAYTVSYTLCADNEIQAGDRYAITAGPYGESFMIYGCYSGYEVVYSAGGANEHKVRFDTGSHKDQWVTITVTVNPDTSVLGFYINGELFAERIIADWQGFSRADLYSFTIGGQGTINGADGAQFFEGSISDVRVYDFALSARNVRDLYENLNGDTPLSSYVSYRTVEKVEVNTADVDLVLSSVNTVEDVLAGLPATATVTDSKEETQVCPVIWLGEENGLIRGYVQGCSAANVRGLRADVQLSYVIDFTQPEHGAFAQIQVDGSDYAAGGSFLTGVSKTLTFKVTADQGYQVSSVVCNNQKIEPDSSGLYTVSVDNYSLVTAYISAEEYTITYVLNNGEENETRIYTYGEEVELDTYFTREGYVFAGWYANEDLSGEEVTQIDSLNPSDITLYAKWVEEGGSDSASDSISGGMSQESSGTSGTASGGCGSAVLMPMAFVLAGAAAALLMKKGRKER